MIDGDTVTIGGGSVGVGLGDGTGDQTGPIWNWICRG